MRMKNNLVGGLAAVVAVSTLLTTPVVVASTMGSAAADEPCAKIYGAQLALLKAGQATKGGAVLRITNSASCEGGTYEVTWPDGRKVVRIRPGSEGVAKTKLPRLSRGDRVKVVYRSLGHVAGRDSIVIGKS